MKRFVENIDGVDYECSTLNRKELEVNHVSTTKKEVMIPDYIRGYAVERIGENAFAKSDIEKVILPETLRIIGFRAFYKCRNLKNITFPKLLDRISTEAFSCCDGLQSVTLHRNICFETGIFANCKNLRIAKIESGLCLPSGTFENCPLKKLYLPNSMSMIINSALDGVPKTLKIYSENNIVKKWIKENGFNVEKVSDLNVFLSNIDESSIGPK